MTFIICLFIFEKITSKVPLLALLDYPRLSIAGFMYWSWMQNQVKHMIITTYIKQTFSQILDQWFQRYALGKIHRLKDKLQVADFIIVSSTIKHMYSLTLKDNQLVHTQLWNKQLQPLHHLCNVQEFDIFRTQPTSWW